MSADVGCRVASTSVGRYVVPSGERYMSTLRRFAMHIKID